MATVTGFTAARMLAIENDTIVDGQVVGDNLILITRDGTQIDAGPVIGPQGIDGPVGPAQMPTGTFIIGGWVNNPSGYLLMNGQTVVDGKVNFPALAACFPNWVNGNDLIIPDATGTVALVGSPAGIVSGSMTHVLNASNLASHSHTGPSHSHTGSTHVHAAGLHSHYVSGSTSSAGYHAHSYFRASGQSGSQALLGVGGQFYITGSMQATDYEAAHTHSWSGTTQLAGGSSEYGGGDPTGFAGTGATGPTGSGTAVNHTPKNITVKMAVKT